MAKEAPAPKTDEAPTPALAAWENEIEVWFQDMRQNLGHLDTAVHNHLHAAKEALKARLRGLIA